MWRSAVQVCLGLHIAEGNVNQVQETWDNTLLISPGGLAQLARAPALQAGGQRFESVILHYSGEFEGKGNHIFHLSSLIWNEIFDILTHKTVSKDL